MKKEYPNDRGAFWKKLTKDGQGYLNGTIKCGHCQRTERVNVWRNTFKNTEKQPDYRVQKSKDFGDQLKQQSVDQFHNQQQEEDIPFK